MQVFLRRRLKTLFTQDNSMPRKLMILNKWVWTKLLYWLLEHSWI
jgi:hypothetical protein